MIRVSTLIVVPCLNGVSAAATRLPTWIGRIAAAAWRTRRREMLSVFPCRLIVTSLDSAVSSAKLRPPSSALTIMPFTVERGAVTAEPLSTILALR